MEKRRINIYAVQETHVSEVVFIVDGILETKMPFSAPYVSKSHITKIIF